MKKKALKSFGVSLAWLLTLGIGAFFVLFLGRSWPVESGATLRVSHVEPWSPRPREPFEAISVGNSGSANEAAGASAKDYARVRERLEARDTDGLMAMVRDTDGEAGGDPKHRTRVRVSAVHALAQVGGRRAMASLRDFLSDAAGDLVLRLAAVSALAQRGGDREIAWLRQRLQTEPSGIVREKIRSALEKLGRYQ